MPINLRNGNVAGDQQLTLKVATGYRVIVVRTILALRTGGAGGGNYQVSISGIPGFTPNTKDDKIQSALTPVANQVREIKSNPVITDSNGNIYVKPNGVAGDSYYVELSYELP